MFMGQYQAKALKRYAAISTESRVEAATPHQRVRILFEELLIALDAAALALRSGDRHKAIDKQTRALAILHALESSLDFEKGGDVAISLAIIYREARKRTLEATATNRAELMEQARGYVGEIAEAWNQIATRVE
jgi:flagellar protein FliS